MPSYSFEAKLDRAGQHLKELRTELDSWIKNRPYRITDKLDPDNGDNVIYGQLRQAMPPSITELVGDCLQNLRSSLDHLAYALAIANKGSLTDAEEMQVAFPIFRDSTKFEGGGMKKIALLSAGAQTIIEGLQPCHTKNPTSHWLWSLEKLNNIDKHRRLLINVVSHVGSLIHNPPGTQMEFFRDSGGDGMLRETETELARYRCIEIKTSKRVKVDLRPKFIVVLGDIPSKDLIAGMVPHLLDNSHRWIGEVIIPRLQPHL